MLVQQFRFVLCLVGLSLVGIGCEGSLSSEFDAEQNNAPDPQMRPSTSSSSEGTLVNKDTSNQPTNQPGSTSIPGGNTSNPGNTSTPVDTSPPRPKPPMQGGDNSNPYFLDHDKLFECKADSVAYTEQRVWRLDNSQYIGSLKATALESINGAGGPLSGDSASTSFKNYAQNFSIVEPQFLSLQIASAAAADTVLGNKGRLPDCIKSAIDTNVKPNKDCIGGLLFGRVINRAFVYDNRGQWASDSVARTEAFIDDLGVKRGLKKGVQMVFLSPEFLFRFELGDANKVDEHGRMPLTPSEAAVALQYALSDKPFVIKDYKEKLKDAASIGLFIDEYFQNPKRKLAGSNTAPMNRFFASYLKHPKGGSVFKDSVTLKKAGLSANYSISSELANSSRVVEYILSQDTQVMEELLTTNLKSVAKDKNKNYVPEYHPGSETRLGILSHKSWLVGHSDNFENDPIDRGHFIRTKLLCQGIPEIPIGVVPILPEPKEGDTLRDRLKVHTDSKDNCVGCHQFMDPLGLPFERFDHMGQWREQEEGKPVNVTGEIVASGDPSIDGPVQDHAELLQKLAASPRVKQCMVRHLFRHTMGRNETYRDACTLKNAYDSYNQSGGQMRATLKSILTSDSFIYRKPVTQEPSP